MKIEDMRAFDPSLKMGLLNSSDSAMDEKGRLTMPGIQEGEEEEIDLEDRKSRR